MAARIRHSLWETAGRFIDIMEDVVDQPGMIRIGMMDGAVWLVSCSAIRPGRHAAGPETFPVRLRAAPEQEATGQAYGAVSHIYAPADRNAATGPIDAPDVGTPLYGLGPTG